MERETKANLVFLVVLLVVLAPGAVMLFNKKLDPNEPAMYMPAPVRTLAAYNDPMPSRPGSQRVAPPRTTSWVLTQTRDRLTPRRDERTDWLTRTISARRTFEISAVLRDPQRNVRLAIAAWDMALVEHLATAAFTLDGHPLIVEQSEVIEVPDHIRKELGRLGYARVPRQIGWIELHGQLPADAAPTGTHSALDVRFGQPEDRTLDTCDLPMSLAAD